jgi:hypothetical protein
MTESNYQEIAKELFVLHNKLREQPSSFIPHVQEYMKFIKGGKDETGYIFAKPRENYVMLHEGKVAFEEAIEFLKTQKAVPQLLLDGNLCLAAEDHLNDIGPNGLVSHESSDGKNVSDRVERYSEWETALGENLDFGTKSPMGILINLLVDDGNKARPHRKHLFSETYQYVGIAVGPHKEYNYAAVLDYAGNVRKLGTPFFDFRNYKYQYPTNLEEKSKKPKTPLQLEDPDAPDEAVSVKMVKSGKLFNGRYHKITKKFYTLKDGTTHIVEVEDL